MTKDQTFIRVYFEDANLILRTDSGSINQASYSQSNVVQFNASVGTHTLKFEHFTEQAKKKRLLFNNFV